MFSTQIKYNVDANHAVVTLKKTLVIPSYPHHIFSVKLASTNEATVIFQENKNELRHKRGTIFKIYVRKRLYSLMTAEDNKNTENICRGYSTRRMKYWVITNSTTKLNYPT